MKRVLATVALAVVPLLAVATPAAAAPPQRTVQTECVTGEDNTGVCFTIRRTVKNTITPSGNRIVYMSGSDSVTVTTSDGAARTSVPRAFRVRYVINHRTPGAFKVYRSWSITTYPASGDDLDVTCTETDIMKTTNGKVQFSRFDVVCNF